MKKTKQCLIITSYNNYELVEKSVLKYRNSMDCFVHMDKKNYSDYWYKRLSSINGCRVFSIFSIKWGSMNHVQAVLYLLRQAKDYNYYHIIPENSMIIRRIEDYISFFENNDYSYIDCGEINDKLLDRIIYRYYLDYINLRGNIFVRKTSLLLMKIIVFFQKKLGIKKKLNFKYKYKGYLYCDLSAEFVSRMLQFIDDNPEYIEELKTSFVGEEFFFQNVFINLNEKLHINRNSLTFDIWSNERGLPAVLNEDDFKDIKSSNKLYARKINTKVFDAYSKEIDKN